MATLVHKIKDKVRNRSSSRSSLSSQYATGEARNSTEVPDVPKVPENGSRYASSPTAAQTTFPRTSLENSAFHVSRGGQGRPSTDSNVARKPLPITSSPTTTQHRQKYSVGGNQPGVDAAVPARGSSRHGVEQDYERFHNRGPSFEVQQAQETITHNGTKTNPNTVWSVSNPGTQDSSARTTTRRVSIPERLAHKPPADAELSKPLPVLPAMQKSSALPVREAGSSATPIGDPVTNSAWMSPLIDAGTERRVPPSNPRDDNAIKYEALARGHLRLPEDFSLQNTEDTHVYEMQRPAVTQETIVKERTEIVREEITRDIHVHHYFTYQQPIKLVEVLPPKHYFLNLETGEKTEIAPPFGWSMPPSMFPVSPITSHVAGWTRHYLVNDEHPYGIPEEAPLGQQQPVRNTTSTVTTLPRTL